MNKATALTVAGTGAHATTHHRFGVALALLALLLQVVIAGLPMPNMGMRSSAISAQCQTLSPVPVKNQKTDKKPVPVQCPVCQAMHLLGSLLVPPPIFVAQPRCNGPPLQSLALVLFTAKYPAPTNQARAPPSLI